MPGSRGTMNRMSILGEYLPCKIEAKQFSCTRRGLCLQQAAEAEKKATAPLFQDQFISHKTYPLKYLSCRYGLILHTFIL